MANDLFNIEINIGDQVVYGSSGQGETELQVGTVIGIDEKFKSIAIKTPSKRKIQRLEIPGRRSVY